MKLYLNDLWPPEWLGTDHLDAQEDRWYVRTPGGRTVCWVYVIDDTPRPIEERVNVLELEVARLKTILRQQLED